MRKMPYLVLVLPLLLAACASPAEPALYTAAEATTEYTYTAQVLAFALPNPPIVQTTTAIPTTLTTTIITTTQTEPTTLHPIAVYPQLSARDIEVIAITTRADPNSHRVYRSPQNIARVVDYINALEFTGVVAAFYFGSPTQIVIIMRDGSQRHFTHGGSFFAERSDPSLYINWQAQDISFWQIIEETPSD